MALRHRLQHITRREYDNQASWWVRIYRSKRKVQRCYQANFADSRYGGKARALRAAVAWRDEELARLDAIGLTSERSRAPRRVQPGYGYLIRCQKGAANSTHSWTYEAWVAWLRIEDGRAKSTSWSIEKHGEAEAFRNCQEWMQKTRGELRARLNRHGKRLAPLRPVFDPAPGVPLVRGLRAATPKELAEP